MKSGCSIGYSRKPNLYRCYQLKQQAKPLFKDERQHDFFLPKRKS